MNPPLRQMKNSMKEQRKKLIGFNKQRDSLKERWTATTDAAMKVSIGTEGKAVKLKINDIENYLKLCNTAMMKGQAYKYQQLADFRHYKEMLRAK
jgi:hypothetical protein